MADSPDLTRAVTEINEHAEPYRYADRMYRGKVDEVFANPKIATLLKESSKHYRTNLAGAVVDAVLNGLEITSVTIPNAQGQPDEKLTQIFKERVWDANQLDLYMPDFLREVGKEGDAYLFVWEGDDEGTCEVHIRKPVGARMFYSEENPREKAFFAYMWKETSPKRIRINLAYADRVERYVTTAKEPKSARDFTPFTDDDGTWPIPHEYGEVPAFHGRSDHPYGVPDHFNAYGPQNQLNKTIATFFSSMDFQGFPQRAALMDAPLDDDGDLWDQDDNESTAGSGEIDDDPDDLSRLVSAPGRMWMLRNVKELVQLDAANPDAFIKPIDKAVQLMSAATGTPLRFFTGTQGQQPSGASLSEDDKRLTDRKKLRVLLVGAMLQDAFTFAMRKVLGYKDCPEVLIQWAPAQRAELKDQWETIESKQRAGVPRDQTLKEAGYTGTQVDEWREAAPDPGEGLAARIDLLNKLGDAAQKLATAVSLGALDQTTVQKIMAGFLPAPEEDDGEPAPSPEDRTPSAREQAEIVQKIYLGVPNVLSREEAREILARAGFDIDPGAPAPGQ